MKYDESVLEEVLQKLQSADGLIDSANDTLSEAHNNLTYKIRYKFSKISLDSGNNLVTKAKNIIDEMYDIKFNIFR